MRRGGRRGGDDGADGGDSADIERAFSLPRRLRPPAYFTVSRMLAQPSAFEPSPHQMIAAEVIDDGSLLGHWLLRRYLFFTRLLDGRHRYTSHLF